MQIKYKFFTQMNKYMKKRNSHRRVLHKVITLLPEFCALQDKIQQDVNKRKKQQH